MTLPTCDTRVTYPDGAVVSEATVLHVSDSGDGRTIVLLDRTAFHPVDTAWPDQPSDRGSMSDGVHRWSVPEAVTGGIHEGELFLGADLPVRTGTEGWVFVVGHVLEGSAPAVGTPVRIEADPVLRTELSLGHTACHLASLALDLALRDSWTKEPPRDGLGSPAFDALAIQRSRIEPRGSVDTYRIGKSLRRKGFDPSGLDDLAAVAARADEALARWLSQMSEVRIERDADELSARRAWSCRLDDTDIRIPCGGTHVDSLARLLSVHVDLERREVEGGLELVMHTRAVAHQDDRAQSADSIS